MANNGVSASTTVTTQSSETNANANLPAYAIGPTVWSATFNNGSAADQVEQSYIATLSLAATPTTLDLTALVDPLGKTTNFAAVREVKLRNKSTTDGQNVTVKPGASNGWTGVLNSTGQLTLYPSTATNSGMLVLTAPNTTGAVVSGTSKTLALDPGANTISVDIEIYGT